MSRKTTTVTVNATMNPQKILPAVLCFFLSGLGLSLSINSDSDPSIGIISIGVDLVSVRQFCWTGSTIGLAVTSSKDNEALNAIARLKNLLFMNRNY